MPGPGFSGWLGEGNGPGPVTFAGLPLGISPIAKEGRYSIIPAGGADGRPVGSGSANCPLPLPIAAAYCFPRARQSSPAHRSPISHCRSSGTSKEGRHSITHRGGSQLVEDSARRAFRPSFPCKKRASERRSRSCSKSSPQLYDAQEGPLCTKRNVKEKKEVCGRRCWRCVVESSPESMNNKFAGLVLRSLRCSGF